MKIATIKRRLAQGRPMVSVTLRMPEETVITAAVDVARIDA